MATLPLLHVPCVSETPYTPNTDLCTHEHLACLHVYIQHRCTHCLGNIGRPSAFSRTHTCTDPCTCHCQVVNPLSLSPPVASCSQCAKNVSLLGTNCSLACSSQGLACWTFQPPQSSSTNPRTNTTIKGTAVAGLYTQYVCVHACVHACAFTCVCVYMCVCALCLRVLCVFTCMHVCICAHHVHAYIYTSFQVMPVHAPTSCSSAC